MATAPPILNYQPGGGVPSPIPPPLFPPEETSQPEAGITQLVNGQSYIVVAFVTEKVTANWEFTECSVVNTTDVAPLNLWPGILTAKSTTGFTLQLNARPDSDHYFLHWATSGLATADWIVSGGDGTGGGMTIVDVAYSATINVDASAGDGGLLIVQVGTLTGNVTLANPTTPTNRARIEYVLKQDATGNRSLTLDTKFRIPSSSSLVLPVTLANGPEYAAVNAKTRLMAEYDLADDKWDVIAFVPGY